LARNTVIIGAGTATEYVTPDGWRMTGRIKRSDFNGGVYWLVFQHE
jgi:hypothetical protein